MGLFHKKTLCKVFGSTWCESSQELSIVQEACEIQQALAEAAFQSVITGVITTGQRKLLRILQWVITFSSVP